MRGFTIPGKGWLGNPLKLTSWLGIPKRYWPELLGHIESRQVFGPGDVPALGCDHVLPGQGGEAYGLGQVVGQCGRYKPSARAPIRGLFYVGYSAGGSGLGSDRAVDSGINVARMVYEYHQSRPWELRQRLQRDSARQ